jgi:hypothetical protein
MDRSPVVGSANVCASIGPNHFVVPFVTDTAGLVIATFGSYVRAAGMLSVTVIGEPPPFTTSSIIPEPHAIASPPPAAATGVITTPARVMVWVVKVAIWCPSFDYQM